MSASTAQTALNAGRKKKNLVMSLQHKFSSKLSLLVSNLDHIREEEHKKRDHVQIIKKMHPLCFAVEREQQAHFPRLFVVHKSLCVINYAEVLVEI